jgi:hypothetical protein
MVPSSVTRAQAEAFRLWIDCLCSKRISFPNLRTLLEAKIALVNLTVTHLRVRSRLSKGCADMGRSKESKDLTNYDKAILSVTEQTLQETIRSGIAATTRGYELFDITPLMQNSRDEVARSGKERIFLDKALFSSIIRSSPADRKIANLDGRLKAYYFFAQDASKQHLTTLRTTVPKGQHKVRVVVASVKRIHECDVLMQLLSVTEGGVDPGRSVRGATTLQTASS